MPSPESASTSLTSRQRLSTWAREQWHDLIDVKSSDRPWALVISAAVAACFPLFVGAHFQRMDLGLMASLGGMVLLSLPHAPFLQCMMVLMAAAFGMVGSYALGALSQFWPSGMMLTFTFLATVITMVGRAYRLGPPGSLFFVMAAALAAYAPATVDEVPLRVGVVAMGSMWACLVGLLYSLYSMRYLPQAPMLQPPSGDFDTVIYEPIVIGVFVGLSLFLAEALGFSRPYWAPVSCLAIIQGVSMRAAWSKQTHRVLGTLVGLLLAWALLSLPLNLWTFSCVMTVLMLCIETLVVRHYASAVMFITPLTVYLAEALHLEHIQPWPVIEARLLDTVLGALMGVVGAYFIHHPSLRGKLSHALRTALRRLKQH